ncbi:hypothetical protein E2C01_059338 [Portunus trituberculatus]|uniref:Uncharacterized protein n=1 Tax=Portunus trituberculatus TaxID=210409 RepID=A0A5B7H7A9_PORTR|nr:hypothetical protein [Portunus trituberculatus]
MKPSQQTKYCEMVVDTKSIIQASIDISPHHVMPVPNCLCRQLTQSVGRTGAPSLHPPGQRAAMPMIP